MRRRADGALKSALAVYGFGEHSRRRHRAMAAAETETLILHELGEQPGRRDSPRNGSGCSAVLHAGRAELFARAARDHLADCTSTLPALLERDASGSLHVWFRRQSAPALRRDAVSGD